MTFQRGARNPNWNGGHYIDSWGYVRIKAPSHPRANARGYVFEHILIAEEMIGRPLVYVRKGHPDNEVVHHKDEVKDNNCPKNLAVVRQEDHSRHHYRQTTESNGLGTF